VQGSRVSADGRKCTARHNGKQENNDKVSFSQSRGAGDSLDRLRRRHHLVETGKMDNMLRHHFQRTWTH
jgi:hypothetical protein